MNRRTTVRVLNARRGPSPTGTRPQPQTARTLPARQSGARPCSSRSAMSGPASIGNRAGAVTNTSARRSSGDARVISQHDEAKNHNATPRYDIAAREEMWDASLGLYPVGRSNGPSAAGQHTHRTHGSSGSRIRPRNPPLAWRGQIDARAHQRASARGGTNHVPPATRTAPLSGHLHAAASPAPMANTYRPPDSTSNAP
jgi:hypothetical protein